MEEYETVMQELIATQRRLLSLLYSEKNFNGTPPSLLLEEKSQTQVALNSLLQKKRRLQKKDTELKSNSEYQTLHDQHETLTQKIKDLTKEIKNLSRAPPQRALEKAPKPRPLMLEDDVL